MQPKIAGTLLFLAGSIILMGIITGEIFYPPGYHTSVNDISDLGATRPPNSVIYQPSATIFNTTMLISGILILAGGAFIQRYFRKWLFGIVFTLFGLGILGVGIFPGNMAPYHGIFALVTFFFGALSALATFQLTTTSFRVFGLVFGLISLVFLFLSNSIMPYLGSGGTERWVAYPIVLWLVGLGGLLLGLSEPKEVMIQKKIKYDTQKTDQLIESA